MLRGDVNASLRGRWEKKKGFEDRSSRSCGRGKSSLSGCTRSGEMNASGYGPPNGCLGGSNAIAAA